MPSPSTDEIREAAAILRRGGLVAFPTETVYGLGADASNPTAVAKVFAAKGRPQTHPVIVHLADFSQVGEWAASVSPAADQLAKGFWPGPLTLILRRAARVSDAITGGQETVGLRVPAHPVAQALLRAFGGGIAAPSANRFGHISPTTAQHVRADLGDRVEIVLDGGPCPIGIESTIVDVSGAAPALLRRGSISAAQIEEVLGVKLAVADSRSPRAPGTLASHYAPSKPLKLVDREELNALFDRGEAANATVLARAPIRGGVKRWLIAAEEPTCYARELYAKLREADRSACELILVEAPPDDECWAAIRDRLQRASGQVF